MNLCFVCNEYPPAPYGGIGNGTRILARAAVRAGHRVRVVGCYLPQYTGADSGKDRFEVDQGVEVYRMPTRPLDLISIRSRVDLFRTISRWARRGEIDMVEVPDPEGWAAGWPDLPIPVTARVHGSIAYFATEANRRFSRLTFHVERASMARADYWSSVSRYAEEKTAQIFKLKTPGTVLHPAVELPESTSWERRSANRVVYAGTLTLKKGILSLVKAWPLVQSKHPAAELHIFGKETRAEDGRRMSEFLLSQLGTAARASIIFHGHAPKGQLVEALRTARAAVYPSFAEAFAAAPMEAMAHGCPVVYTSRSSGRELIDDGVDGLLIDPAQPEQIAERISALLEDETLARRIGQAGRAKIEHRFTADTAIDSLIRYYAQCVKEFAGANRLSSPVCSSRS